MSEFSIAAGVTAETLGNGVVISPPGGRSALEMAYPEAAVWDLVTRGYGRDDMERMLAAILGVSAAQAVDLVRSALPGWVKSGLLVQETSSGGSW